MNRPAEDSGGETQQRNDPMRSLYASATRAACLGLLINIGLGVAKLLGGLLGHSFALISDAVNSIGDALASVMVLFALKVAQRPPDAEHPYGHTRAEAIAGSNVALIIILSAVAVAWGAIGRMGNVQPMPPIWTLWLAGGNVLIKESLYRYKLQVGRRTRSSALLANAWDHRSDAICSLAVLMGLSMIRLGGPSWGLADELAALVVAVAIAWSGARLFRASASELMDGQAEKALIHDIHQAASAVPQVEAIEKLWVRKSGLEFFADIHVEVAPHITVAQGHAIGHEVKDRLLEQFSSLRDVLVHLEPTSTRPDSDVHDAQ